MNEQLELRLRCAGDQGFALELDCALPARGITAVYGPSGSGKTTLLQCIAGLRQPAPDSLIRFAGTTWQAEGRAVPVWQRRIGFVFNDARLFPHLSVEDNLQYAIARQQAPAGVSLAQAVAWLELDALLSRTPATLSAGQQQRVAIARALLSAPQLLLLDEPLANLDHAASQHCLRCLQRVAAELSLPMLYVSHDIEEVSQLADHVLLLEAGRAVGQGALLDLCGRLDTRLSQAEQAAAILCGEVARHDSEFGLSVLRVEDEPVYVGLLPDPPGTPRRLRIPARDVSLCRQRPADSSILNILPVTVEELETGHGPRLMLRLALGRQHLLARITRKSAVALDLKVGDRLYAQVKSAALLSGPADAA